MNDVQRQRLLELAQHRAQQHPADLERALEVGMRAFRRKVALTYAAVWTVVAATVIVLGTSAAALGRDSEPEPGQATLESIEVRPHQRVLRVGAQQRFRVVGAYSDGSSREPDEEVEWSSSVPRVVRIDQQGLATAVSTGTATITARVGTVIDSAELAVRKPADILRGLVVQPPEAVLRPGEVQEFTAVGTFADQTSRDLSSEVDWSTSDPAVLTIDQRGRATAVAEGSTTVTASLRRHSDTATVTVTGTERSLERVDVVPPSAELVPGERTSFTARGTYTDGTVRDISGEVEWVSGDVAVVSIDDAGRATALGPGATTITAAAGPLRGSAEVSVRVPPRTLTAIEVAPAGTDLCDATTRTQGMTATAVYDDGVREGLDPGQVQWSTSAADIIAIDPGGTVSSPDGTEGRAVITAAFEGVSGTAVVVCDPDPPPEPEPEP